MEDRLPTHTQTHKETSSCFHNICHPSKSTLPFLQIDNIISFTLYPSITKYITVLQHSLNFRAAWSSNKQTKTNKQNTSLDFHAYWWYRAEETAKQEIRLLEFNMDFSSPSFWVLAWFREFFCNVKVVNSDYVIPSCSASLTLHIYVEFY